MLIGWGYSKKMMLILKTKDLFQLIL